MKKLFQAIRKKENDTVKQLIEKKPELVNCTAKQPPKKDDGQSPLQVALKTGNFEIANFLLDRGADVNFMEDAQNCCNDWRMPVLHDAIVAAVSCCRHNSIIDLGSRQIRKEHSSEEKADESFGVLKRMLEMGADVHAKESFGASCVWRLCRTAGDLLPGYSWGEHRVFKNAEVTPEWRHDLGRIFLLLKEYGADFSDEEISRYLAEEQHPLREFLALL